MGAACSSDPEAKTSKSLNKILADNKKHQPKRLLLLGAGQAGKSTIFKQVKIIYADGFDQDSRKSYRVTIHANIVESIKTLISQAEKRAVALDPAHTGFASQILALSLDEMLTPETGRIIHTLWTNDKAIREIFEQRSTFQLGDSAEYMLNHVIEFCEPSYIPSEEDILRVRVRTSGIVEFRFVANKVDFLIMDVGGQRGERRKWIHCFDDVEAVLFVAAISEFDQVLQEDESTNRLLEAIDLFKDIANLEAFQQTSMILFLNKRDIFEEKFTKGIGNLADVFPDYPGGLSKDDAIDFILNKFLEVRDDENQEIYFHITCATDKDNIRFVLSAVRDIVVRRNLRDANML